MPTLAGDNEHLLVFFNQLDPSVLSGDTVGAAFRMGRVQFVSHLNVGLCLRHRVKSVSSDFKTPEGGLGPTTTP